MYVYFQVKYSEISSQLDEANEKIEKCRKEIDKLNKQSEEKQKLLDMMEKKLVQLRWAQPFLEKTKIYCLFCLCFSSVLSKENII